MAPEGQPKFRRRKAARPDEIAEAALEVFAEKGFAAARLEDIARRAGVSKGALYLYFATKEDIFRAVVVQAVAPNLRRIQALAADHSVPFADLAQALAALAPQLMAKPQIGAVVKMVIGEARNFPEIARIWHDQVVNPALEALSAAISSAQARGEVRPGDPQLYAVGLIGALLAAIIWRETFVPIGAAPFNLQYLAHQHFETALRGMRAEPRP